MAQKAIALLICCLAPAFAQQVCDPMQFGALADGVTKDTVALQAAIDQCASMPGGGMVELAAGTFLSAPLTLRSNITLQIDAGAVLQGSSDMADYASTTGSMVALLHASGEHDVAITGMGTIDGAGAGWWQMVRDARAAGLADPARPRLVTFSSCRRILVDSVTLQNSPSFHIVPSASQDVVINGVIIVAPADSPNTDGIDPSASRNVRITYSVIDVGDDNIAIKSGSDDPDHPGAAAENILITDCHFFHGHGVSIGSETGGGVRNVQVQRSVFKDTQNGLRIKSYRGNGGEVSRIWYSDITMINVSPAVVFTAYYPVIASPADPPQPVGELTPRYHDIKITRLNAYGGDVAGRIVGLPEAPIDGLVLDDVSISAERGLEVRNANIETRSLYVTVTKSSQWIDEGRVTLTDYSDPVVTADAIVAADGTGQFTSIQDAVDSIQGGVIAVRPGIYWEPVWVATPSITLQGSDEFGTELIYDDAALTVTASDFTASGLTIENASRLGPAAVVSADRAAFYGARFAGWQNTLNAATGRQYYRDCLIEGQTDFVTGSATAVFDNCEIHSKGSGAIAGAQQSSGFVFWGSTLTGAGEVYLGRPLGDRAGVTYLNCTMGPQILPAGWAAGDYYLSAVFGEYGSQGPGGDTSRRVSWARILTDAEAAGFDPHVLLAGADGWNPFL